MIKSLKIASLALLALSLIIHFSTYGPLQIFTMDNVWVMHVAVLVVFGVMIFIAKKFKNEKKREQGQKYVDWFRDNLNSQLMGRNNLMINAIPGRLFFLGIVTVIYVFANFINCMIGMEFGGPHIENGQYLLKNHGNIIRVLSETEFIKMKAYELRLFSGHWLIFSYVPTLFFSYVYPATLIKRRQETELNNR
jgi:hypothetical protein